MHGVLIISIIEAPWPRQPCFSATNVLYHPILKYKNASI